MSWSGTETLVTVLPTEGPLSCDTPSSLPSVLYYTHNAEPGLDGATYCPLCLVTVSLEVPKFTRLATGMTRRLTSCSTDGLEGRGHVPPSTPLPFILNHKWTEAMLGLRSNKRSRGSPEPQHQGTRAPQSHPWLLMFLQHSGPGVFGNYHLGSTSSGKQIAKT